MYDTSKLEILKKFGLNKNHIKLLVFFLNNMNVHFSVKEISKQTKIPLSRVYPHLNDLHTMKLINKRVDQKDFYFLDDPETRLRRFLIQKDFELKELQRSVLDTLNSFYISEKFVTIKSSEEFYQSVYQIVKDIKMLKVFAHTPALIFLEEDAHYWKKQVIELYKRKIKKKKFELYYLIDENYFKEKIIRNNRNVVIKKIEWLNNQENVHLKVIDGARIISTALTEKEVILGFTDPKERKVMRAILFRSNELLNFFTNLYDNLFDKGKKVGPNMLQN